MPVSGPTELSLDVDTATNRKKRKFKKIILIFHPHTDSLSYSSVCYFAHLRIITQILYLVQRVRDKLIMIIT